MVRPYYSGPQRRGHVQQAFGDRFDRFVKIFLQELPGIGSQIGDAKSATGLKRLLQKHFLRRFGVDVSRTHRALFVWSTRNLWQELAKQRHVQQRSTNRRGIHAKVRAVRKLVGL